MRELTISGIPEGVVVRASSRRRKTITAFRERGTTVVVVPERMNTAGIRSAVLDLVQRLESKSRRRSPTDTELHARAEALRQTYLPEAPAPVQVTWSSRQQRRWGSCTPADRTIRLSEQLRGMPDYVVDSVLVHELAHLLHHGHGAKFKAVVARFPHLERAEAYLAGFSHARELALAELTATGNPTEPGPSIPDQLTERAG